MNLSFAAPPWRPMPLTAACVSPLTPTSSRADTTASCLQGLTIALTSKKSQFGKASREATTSESEAVAPSRPKLPFPGLSRARVCPGVLPLATRGLGRGAAPAGRPDGRLSPVRALILARDRRGWGRVQRACLVRSAMRAFPVPLLSDSPQRKRWKFPPRRSSGEPRRGRRHEKLHRRGGGERENRGERETRTRTAPECPTRRYCPRSFSTSSRRD